MQDKIFMMDDNNISVVINTYNAETHLKKVLDSVKEFNEIVICDMESTDKTLDIARSYGCHIVAFPKGDCVSAEPARTFAIQSASSKWVLVIDADELVTPALKDHLYQRIAQPDCPAGLYIPRQNLFMGTYLDSLYPDFQLRFFIREGTVWPPYVHTFPQVSGRLEKLDASNKSLALLHLADDSVADIIRKTNLYTESEVEKKFHKGYGALALTYRPFWRFFRSYLLKGGIRNGVPGFIHACLEGIYQFVIVAKIIEKRDYKKDNSQEK